MASLKSLLGSRNISVVEENLETGKIWSYTPGTTTANFAYGFCWMAPGTGTATIEVWGASGSSSRMCCCGFSLPGNPGAYSKKTISVVAGCYVCGTIGRACQTESSLCDRGCSESTGLCWFGSGTNGCMCAQGGKAGISFCTTGTAMVCCYSANGFCCTYLGTYGATICNACSGAWMACAYGGDVNCCGGFSCASIWCCDPACSCYVYQHIAISPGITSTNGAVVTFVSDNQSASNQWTGQGRMQLIGMLNALSKNPSAGVPFTSCWGGNVSCGCYESDNCQRRLPVGVPASMAFSCPNVRDGGSTGGDGAVRIRFV